MPFLKQCACIAAGLVVLSICGSNVRGELAETAAPDDLVLTDAQLQQSRALSHFAWGLLMQLDGKVDFDAVAEEYLAALRYEPDSTLVLEHLISPYFVARKFDKIVEVLGPFAEAHPEQSQVQLVLADALQAQSRNDEAAEVLTRALDGCDWREPILLRELFVSLWREKRYTDVRHVLAKAWSRKNLRTHFVVEHATALFYHALFLAKDRGNGSDAAALGAELEDLPSAGSLGRRARRHALRASHLLREAERPGDVESLANVLLNLGLEADALAMLREACGMARFSEDPTLQLLLARSLVSAGETSEALRVLRKLTDTADVPPMLYADIARAYRDAGDLERAAQFLERSLLSYPRVLAIRLQLAYVYLLLNQPKKGLATLAPVKELTPRAHFLVAHLYRLLRDNQRALKALRAAAESKQETDGEKFLDAEFYLFYATVAEDAGETDLSLEQAEKAFALDPQDAVSANFIGYILADHNRDLDRAEKFILQALTVEPESVAYLDSLAWVYYRQRRFPEALQEIGKALRGSGESPDPVILDHAGDICAANGYTLLARHYWLWAISCGALRPEIIRGKVTGLPVMPDNQSVAVP